MIKILAIEDEEIIIDAFSSGVETYNLRNKLNGENKISIRCVQSTENLYKILFYERFDCLIVDIGLGRSNPKGGKALIKEIINKKRIPIVVYSGKLDLIEDIDDSNIFGFRKFDKTDQISKVLDYIVEIKNTHFFDILGYDGHFDKVVAKVFWEEIDEINNAIPKGNQPDSNSILRMLTTRIESHLSSTKETAIYKYYEFFIKPILTKDCHNGDIYKIKDDFYLVITPECQLLKIETVNLLKINVANETDNNFKECKKRDKKISSLGRSITDPKCYEHYIPPFDDYLNSFVVDFREIITIKKTKLKATDKILTINPMFMKNIQARFSQYFSRQGQPDIDHEHLFNQIYES